MKWDRSSGLMTLYCLFTILYTLYIAGHSRNFGSYKDNGWGYYLEFLLLDAYVFFILQGLILRSKNWGVLLLLPPGILIATVIGGFLMVGIIRLGGGTLLDQDYADRVLVALIWLTLSFFALRLIRTGKKARK